MWVSRPRADLAPVAAAAGRAREPGRGGSECAWCAWRPTGRSTKR
jgi:hypothetical protein